MYKRQYLGAGTLESLLVNEGPAVIDRVLERARRDPDFRLSLIHISEPTRPY